MWARLAQKSSWLPSAVGDQLHRERFVDSWLRTAPDTEQPVRPESATLFRGPTEPRARAEATVEAAAGTFASPAAGLASGSHPRHDSLVRRLQKRHHCRRQLVDAPLGVLVLRPGSRLSGSVRSPNVPTSSGHAAAVRLVDDLHPVRASFLADDLVGQERGLPLSSTILYCDHCRPRGAWLKRGRAGTRRPPFNAPTRCRCRPGRRVDEGPRREEELWSLDGGASVNVMRAILPPKQATDPAAQKRQWMRDLRRPARAFRGT